MSEGNIAIWFKHILFAKQKGSGHGNNVTMPSPYIPGTYITTFTHIQIHLHTYKYSITLKVEGIWQFTSTYPWFLLSRFHCRGIVIVIKGVIMVGVYICLRPSEVAHQFTDTY